MERKLFLGAIAVLFSMMALAFYLDGGMTGNVVWGENWCTKAKPCPNGEGDCDVAAHCQSGNCVQNVGMNYGKAPAMDVCEAGCTNECSPKGTRQCFGNTSRTCGNYDSDSCLEWNTGTACERCANGICQRCANGCSLGQQRCSNGYAQACGNFDSDSCLEFGNILYCQNGCVNGTCKCISQCTAGQTQCNGNTISVCSDLNKDGCTEWGNGSYCDNGCSNGACVQYQNQCSDTDGYDTYMQGYVYGTYRGGNYTMYDYCQYNATLVEQFCSGTEARSSIVDCPMGCESGACINQSCNDICGPWGARICQGSYMAMCNDGDGDGCLDWINSSYCANGCRNGACVTCTPTCMGKQCGDNGCGGTCGTCQSGYACNGSQCLSSCANECTQGAKRCSGSYAQTCSNYDSDSCTEWGSGTYCANGCSNGACTQNYNSCYDSDAGMDGYNAGYVAGVLNGSNSTQYDYCSSNYVVIENYCYMAQQKSTPMNCTYGCSNGKCQ